MTTRLTLLVHGETTAARRAAFSLDEPLLPRAMAAGKPTTPRHERALTSPARAARETAAALGLAADVDERLGDLATGGWAGRTLAEVLAADPVGGAAFFEDPGFAGHGGESIVELIARVRAWLERHGDRGRIVAVTHSAIVRAAIVAALGAAPSAFWHIDVGPLATIALTSNGRRWALRFGAVDADQLGEPG